MIDRPISCCGSWRSRRRPCPSRRSAGPSTARPVPAPERRPSVTALRPSPIDRAEASASLLARPVAHAAWTSISWSQDAPKACHLGLPSAVARPSALASRASKSCVPSGSRPRTFDLSSASRRGSCSFRSAPHSAGDVELLSRSRRTAGPSTMSFMALLLLDRLLSPKALPMISRAMTRPKARPS
jgi:hypothetical protein